MRKAFQAYLRVGRRKAFHRRSYPTCSAGCEVPGVRTVARAEQNAEVIRLGPLGPDAMAGISKLNI